MTKRSDISVIAVTVGILAILGFLFAISARNLGGDDRGAESSIATGSANSLLDAPAPPFALTDARGETYTNETFKGKKVVFFFNEGLRCYPACWNAMTALGNDPRFTQDDTAAFSVVTDAPGEWKRAAEKVPELSNVRVLFDANAAAARAFGMLNMPSSMHVGTLPGHTYVILDDSGAVRFILDDPRMGIRNDEVASRLSTLDVKIRL